MCGRMEAAVPSFGYTCQHVLMIALSTQTSPVISRTSSPSVYTGDGAQGLHDIERFEGMLQHARHKVFDDVDPRTPSKRAVRFISRHCVAPGMKPNSVSRQLMSRSLSHSPFSAKTPRGGRTIARTNLKISVQVSAIVVGRAGFKMLYQSGLMVRRRCG
jgi:hypothetical protein